MFSLVKKQLQDNFQSILSLTPHLFYVSIDRDEVWNQYLTGFEQEVMQEHNCNSCKSFLRQYAGIVGIINGERVSIWDGLTVDNEYQKSIDNLRKYIHSLPITDVFMNEFASCGTDKNVDKVSGVVWQHFYINLPGKFVVRAKEIDSRRGELRTNKETFMRSLEELSIDSTETVLDLIAQGSLYRGKEFEPMLNQFLALQKEYASVPLEKKENYCWVKSLELNGVSTRVRNTAIGTLLVDLSGGMDLDSAVTRFEKVVAPTNYKRPTALITPRMVEDAKTKLQELGLIDSLERRFANETDLSTQNVLYVDKSSGLKDVFDTLASDTKVNPKSLNKVEEISINDFISNVLPRTKSLEVLVENSHLNNFASLLTSVNTESPSLFKWNNNFSWSYTGGITDSIKERVKAAGGGVDGKLRVSLSWFNYDDLDLHLIEPGGNRICYSNKRSRFGFLDVDMNAGGGTTREAVENIIYRDTVPEGKYYVEVNNFAKRETIDTGFIIQIEADGQIYDIEFDKSPGNRDTTKVIGFTYSYKDGIKFDQDIQSKVVSKQKWGINTNQFVKVKQFMLSPNYWNNNTGNKHFMFFLENCINDESPRPFFNEFLKEEFNENRKVFEVMGSKLKVEPSEYQLSGISFSETQRNHLLVRVDGNFKRVLKINF